MSFYYFVSISPSATLLGGAELNGKSFGQLVKMLTTLEPHGIFRSNIAYLFSLTLSRHWYAKRQQGFVEHLFGQSRYFSANAHDFLNGMI